MNYLYGTIHTDDPRALALLDAALPHLDTCKTMVTEVVLDAQAARESAAKMILGNGQTLPAILGEPLYGEVAALLEPKGLPKEQVATLKPWAAMTLIAFPESPSGKVVDSVLYERAVGRGKKVAGLETVDEQLDALDGMSETDQVELLRATVEGAGELPALLNGMVDAYAAEDLDRLESLGRAQVGSVTAAVEARFLQRLLHLRNERMVDRMQDMLNVGGACVAVGALHLAGESGVLHRLAQRGYELAPVALGSPR